MLNAASMFDLTHLKEGAKRVGVLALWLPHPQPPPCLLISCHWRYLGPMLVRVRCARGRLQGPTVAHTGVIRGDRLTPLPPHRRCHRFLLLLLGEGWTGEVGRVSSAGTSSSGC